ncbi:MAG: hypothetical protein GX886_13265, partial [Comamonadaceae bacterium]|nr:hypothetical protein [Comamonadaceae bacterium]
MDSIALSRRAALGAAAAVVLAAGVARPAHAQNELILLEAARTAPFINGGIGKDDEAYMRKIARDWPLRMAFSERGDN